jgi:hypothetical protein
MDHPTEAYVRGVQADHQEMETLARTLRGSLAAGERQRWSADGTYVVIRELSRMQEHLERHFALEEEGGYLEEALAMAPRLGPQASKLLAQHAEFKQAMFKLVAAAERSRKTPALWPRLARQIEELLKRLEAHESAENRIIQAGFNVDLEMQV